ncbi:MAG: TatD family hydrolase [Candidatus Paceibacterota bacterium]|jgi:TatD DNase family protein
MFEYFDSHSHLNLSEYDLDREDVIKNLKEKNIGTITIGVDRESSERAIALAEKYKNLFAGIGMHPVDNREEVFNREVYEKMTMHPKVVCIGECGLDYFRLTENIEAEKERQKKLFREHVAISVQSSKPLMLHCRPSKGTMDAYEDTLEILENYKLRITNDELGSAEKIKILPPGNAHFFVGDITIAKRFLALGFTMSFPGVITFARDYDDVIKMLPLENILSETDAPFAAPVPYRGKRNSPEYVTEVVKKIAEIRREDLEMVRQAMVENSQKLFKISLFD